MRPQGSGNIIQINGVADPIRYDKLSSYLSWEAFSTGQGAAGSGQGVLAPGLPVGRVLWPCATPERHGVNFWRCDAMLALKLGDKLYAMEDQATPAPTDSFRPMQIGTEVVFSRGNPPDRSLCVVVRGTGLGTRTNHVAFSIDGGRSELIADWRGTDAPDLSSVVRDIDDTSPDTSRFWASLESMMKVVETVPAPFGMAEGATLALNMAACPSPSQNAGGKVGWGAMAFETQARQFNKIFSKNPVTGSGAQNPRQAEGEEEQVGGASQIVALSSAAAGGPLSSLAVGSKLRIGTNAEGVPVHSAGLFCDAVFSFEAANWEGPIHFEREEYSDPAPQPFRSRAHIYFDRSQEYDWRGRGVKRRGKWKVEAESNFQREEYFDVFSDGETRVIIRNNNIEMRFPSWQGTPSPLPTSGGGGGGGGGGGDGNGEGSGGGGGQEEDGGDGEDPRFPTTGGGVEFTDPFANVNLTIFDKDFGQAEEERIRRNIRESDRDARDAGRQIAGDAPDSGRSEGGRAEELRREREEAKRKRDEERAREKQERRDARKNRQPYGGKREDENLAEYDKRKQRNKNFARGLAGLSQPQEERDSVFSGSQYSVENDELLLPEVSHVKVIGQIASGGGSYVYNRDPIIDDNGFLLQRATGPGILAFGPAELTSQDTFAAGSENTDPELSDFQVMLYGDTKLGFGCTNDNGSQIVAGTTIGKRDDNGLAFETVDTVGDAKSFSATTLNNSVNTQITTRKIQADDIVILDGYVGETRDFVDVTGAIDIGDGAYLDIAPLCCCEC